MNPHVKTKRGSVRRTRSPDVGPGAAPGHQPPTTSGPPRPTSSAPSALQKAGRRPGPAPLHDGGDGPPPRRDRRHGRPRRPRHPHPRQGGWHISKKLDVPANITLVPLPAKSPELNPVENIWQFMRDNWLSNRVFKSYDDIVDHCCFAWNRLIDQPWKFMSIGLREWAYRSRSTRLGIT